MTKFTSKHLLSLVLLVVLAGCQGLNGLSPSPQVTSMPVPLTGGRASALGASALLIEQKPFNAGGVLVPVSADTGKPVSGYTPIDIGSGAQFAFSADREKLAFITSYSASCSLKCLHVLDLRAWKEILTPFSLNDNDSDWPIMAYNPAGTQIAAAFTHQASPGGKLVLIDVAQGKVVQTATLGSNVQMIGFTPDGSIAVYGNLEPVLGKTNIMYVTLFDGASLQVKWQQNLDEVSYGTESQVMTDPSQGVYLNPAPVFSPDGSKLYVVAADAPRLVTVDLSRQKVQSAEIRPPQSWLERLLADSASVVYAKLLNGTSKTAVLSQDGKTLYVVGQTYTAVKDQNGDWSTTMTPLGMQAVDVSNGAEVSKLETLATAIGLAQDGKTILLTGWDNTPTNSSYSWTDMLEAGGSKVTGRLSGEIVPSRLLDGSLVYLSSIYPDIGETQLAIYNPGSQTPRSKPDTSGQDYPFWLAIP